MRILDTNVNAVGGNAVALSNRNRETELRVQVSFDAGITGTATIRARVSDALPWVVQKVITASEIVSLGFVEFVQVELTGATGGGGASRVTAELAV